jgi:hypothetical protein
MSKSEVCSLRQALDLARTTSRPERLLRAAVTVGCVPPCRATSGDALTGALPAYCVRACQTDATVVGLERKGRLR